MFIKYAEKFLKFAITRHATVY